MSLTELFAGGGGIVLLLMTLVEVSKIKINPWSWIATHVGRAINGEVMEKVSSLSDKVDKLEIGLEDARHTDERRDIETRRVRILRFGEELLQDKPHTKEYFDQTLMDITKYEKYCKANPDFENDVTTLTIAHIKTVYEHCRQKHSFL